MFSSSSGGEKWAICGAGLLIALTFLALLMLSFCNRTAREDKSEREQIPSEEVVQGQQRTPTVRGDHRARIQMRSEGGTYVVPALVNEVITLEFTVDSGASDVTIP